MRYVNQQKRQFIAGAVCPECRAQDTIVRIVDGDDEHIECVNCDHTDVRPDAEETAKDLATDAMQAQTADVGIVQFRHADSRNNKD